MLKLVSFHIQAHLNAFLQILEYFFRSVDVDGLNLLAYIVFELFDCARGPIKKLYSIHKPATVENSMDLPAIWTDPMTCICLCCAFPHLGSCESNAAWVKMCTVEYSGFLFRKYWQTGSFKACQTAFRKEFGERHEPWKCSIQKLVKHLETRGSRPNTCRLFSLGPIRGQSVQKYTPHNRRNQRRKYAKRFKPSTSIFWKKYSRICRNTFKCVWMWKETSFSIDYEHVLFGIVPGMCIYIFKSLSQ